VAYNSQIGKKKLKVLKEYESVTQKVLWPSESILQNAKRLQIKLFDLHFIFHKHFYILFPV
jgi:hypothetical protein